MIFEFDKFDRYTHPSLFLCNPSEDIIGQISNYQGLHITPKFTDMSEISFDIYKYNEDGEISPLYDKLEKMREILVSDFYVKSSPGLSTENRDLGYFIITQVDEIQNLSNPIKTITGLSCEYELTKRELHYIDGVYKIYEPDNDECLINQIMKRLPKWRLNYIDSDVANLYRTFEFGTNTVYNFLTSDFCETCDAVIDFDIYNRLINIYSKDTYVDVTDQHSGITLSLEDIVTEIKVNSDLEDLYTALYVPSSNDITIATVNPACDNTIYNFDFYMNTEWMSEGLIQALQTVKNNIAQSYSNCNVYVYQSRPDSFPSGDGYVIITHNTTSTEGGVDIEVVTETDCDIYTLHNGAITEVDISNISVTKPLQVLLSYEREKWSMVQSRITTLNESTLAGYEAQKAAVISASTTDTIKNAQLNIINGHIAVTEAEISRLDTVLNNKVTKVNNISSRITTISANNKIENVLTTEQLDELSPFIHEGTFEDPTVIDSEIMSYVEEYEQSEELYDRAMKSLNKLSSPSTTFDIDVDSSLFDIRFRSITNIINTGSIIDVIDDDDDIQEFILHDIDIDFDSTSIVLTFGNRFYLANPANTFADLYASASKTGNTVNYIKDIFNFSRANTELGLSEEFRKSSLDLAKNKIMSSNGQTVNIDDNGYIGRKVVDGATEDEQCWLVNNMLAFTNDGWETVQTALGKIPVYNPNTETYDYLYGLNAEILMGKIILAEHMRISDANGDVDISGNGITVNDGKITIKDSSGNTVIDSNGVVGDNIYIGSKRLDTALSDVETNANEYSDTVLSNFRIGQYATDIANLQQQIDGSITTWFYNYVPTLSNIPASEWTTTELKDRHIGDLFYNTSTGYAYRFMKEGNVYSWSKISDTDISAALAAAQAAQDTADHKRRVFVAQPTVPYDIGDLWTNGTDLYRCKTAKTSSGSYSSADWILATDYVDSTTAQGYASAALADAKSYTDGIESALQSQIDSKIETWYQSTDPSSAWTTTALKQAHTGDIWYNTSASSHVTKRWNGTAWEEQAVPKALLDEVDGKKSVYYQSAQPTGANANDLWVKSDTKDLYVYNGSSWILATDYVDSTTAQGYASAAESNAKSYTDTESSAQSVVNKINNSATTVTIEADHIKLEGYTTINEGFSVDEYGNMKCNAAEAENLIVNNGDFSLDDDGNIIIRKTAEYSGYTFNYEGSVTSASLKDLNGFLSYLARVHYVDLTLADTINMWYYRQGTLGAEGWYASSSDFLDVYIGPFDDFFTVEWDPPASSGGFDIKIIRQYDSNGKIEFRDQYDSLLGSFLNNNIKLSNGMGETSGPNNPRRSVMLTSDGYQQYNPIDRAYYEMQDFIWYESQSGNWHKIYFYGGYVLMIYSEPTATKKNITTQLQSSMYLCEQHVDIGIDSTHYDFIFAKSCPQLAVITYPDYNDRVNVTTDSFGNYSMTFEYFCKYSSSPNIASRALLLFKSK